MLSDLPEDMATLVTNASRPVRFAAGDVICHAGEAGHHLYMLRWGHAAVGVQTPLGQLLTFTILGPGQSFGELSLLMEKPVRSATVWSLDACEILTLRDTDLERLRRDHPRLTDALLKAVASQVLRLSDRLVELLYLPVETRVRRRLVELEQVYRGDAMPTVIPLSQDHVSALSGAARPTVNRVLRQEEAEGVLTLHRGRITIIDTQRLRQRAELES